jgi:molecular chaperone DnaJ
MFGSMQVQSACPDCGGEGKIFSKKCHECSGVGVVKDEVRLKIKIPAGIDNGEAIRLSGQGEAGMKGAPAGDLYLRIKITPDKRFHREGADIRNRVEIGVTKAALGGDVEIETVHGSLTLKIPEGTQSGTVFRLKEKGLPRLHSHGQGDHFVEVTVKVPTHLSKQQKKMLEELAI